MKAYRTAWWAATAATVAVALGSAGARIGWIPAIATTAAMCLMGATFGYAWWAESDRRRQKLTATALVLGCVAAVLLGIPSLIGAWTFVLVGAIALSSPGLVEWLVVERRQRRTVRSPQEARQRAARDLERRWLQTTRELRERRRDPVATLRLVQERAIVLDEIERCDPVGFDALLVRAGWRDHQDR
jgi:hypothetical protein